MSISKNTAQKTCNQSVDCMPMEFVLGKLLGTLLIDHGHTRLHGKSVEEACDDFKDLETFAGYSFGCTVMVPIGKELSESRSQNALRLSQAIANFQRSVETLLPGAYAWLNPSSYHVTLRAIH